MKKKTLSELQEALAGKETEVRTIAEKAVTEKRAITADEQTSLDNLKNEIRTLKVDIMSYSEDPKPNQTPTIITSKTPMKEKRNLITEIFESIQTRKAFSVEICNEKEIEKRAGLQATVAGQGIENVATETRPIIIPSYGQNILEKIGVTMINNPVGDIKVPRYTGSTWGWAGENAASADGAGTFSEVTLKPKRATGYIDVSRRLLEQDSYDILAKLYQDIANGYYKLLEQTIFGAAAGTANKPAGIFNTVAPATVSDYASFLGVEASLVDAGYEGKFYIANSAGYEALRNLSKPDAVVADTHKNKTIAGLSIVDNNTVSGVPLLVSPNMNPGTPSYAIGDFSNIWVANWQGMNILADPYTQAGNFYIRLHFNADVDAALVAPSVKTATF